MPTEGLHPVNDQPFIRLTDFSLHPKIILCRDETGQSVNIAHIYGPDGTFIESKPAVTGNSAQAWPALIGDNVFATHSDGAAVPPLAQVFKNGAEWKDYGGGDSSGPIATVKKIVYAGMSKWLRKIDSVTGSLQGANEFFKPLNWMAANGSHIIINHSSESVFNPADPPNPFLYPRETTLYNDDFSQVAILDIGDPDTLNTGTLGPVAINQDRCALANNAGAIITIRIFDLTGALKETINTPAAGNTRMLLMSNKKLFLGDWKNDLIYVWDITDDGAGNKTYIAAPTITIDGGLFYGNLSTG